TSHAQPYTRGPWRRTGDLSEVGVPVNLVLDRARLSGRLRARRTERHRDRDDRCARPRRSCCRVHRATLAGSRRASPLDLGPMGPTGSRAYGGIMEQLLAFVVPMLVVAGMSVGCLTEALSAACGYVLRVDG